MSIFFRFLVSVIVVVADQITKILADNMIEMYEQIIILPIFNLTLHYNRGAAFSFLDDAGGWQRYLLTAISAIVSIVLIIWLARLARNEKLMTWALALILGGAVGNLIDRAIYGHVIDFIQVHWGNAYFPSFNIADAAITVGAVFLLIATYLEGKQSAVDNGDEASDSDAGHSSSSK